MRILWASNAPWTRTGYGHQTRLFVPRLEALGHEVAIFANYGLAGSILNLSDTIKVYPAGLHAHGNDIIASHAAHYKADIVITLYDSWCFTPDVTARFRWVPWMPVGLEPLPEHVKQSIQTAWQPIAYSKFGERMLTEAEFEPRYVPHGIDTEAFKPGNKTQARKRFNLDDDTFLAVMVAANKGFPARKCFPEVLWAWREFVKKRPNSFLYMHAHSGPELQGVDIPLLLHKLDMPDKVVGFCDTYQNSGPGYPDVYMADIYNAADVMLNPSMGEGFGLPILEAQACGCPVIVTDASSMSELCFAGWKVNGQPFWSPLGAWFTIPNIEEIIDALQMAYKMRGSTALAKEARHGAEPYNVNLVTEEYWKPVLADIAAELGEVDVLQPVGAEGVL